MRTLVTLLAMLSFVISPALANDKQCVHIDGVTYCTTKQVDEVKVGGVDVKVTDPFELLRKSKGTGSLKKIYLYDHYHYLPLVLELAKQNGMGYHEFVSYMIHHWDSKESNPFKTLRDFEELYDELTPEHQRILISGIADDISKDIEEAILHHFGIVRIRDL